MTLDALEGHQSCYFPVIFLSTLWSRDMWQQISKFPKGIIQAE